MATAVLMPRQGQSVETCLILEWKKQPGDTVAEGDILCEVETDKATFEVESPAGGTLIDVFYPAGEDVPVLVNIAAIGEPGENVDDLRGEGAPASASAAAVPQTPAAPETPAPAETAAPASVATPAGVAEVILPRQGQSVETCLILGWKKSVGDAVAAGDILCEVETDKATFEVEAPAAGTLLATFCDEGDDVPVLALIAAIGPAGTDISGMQVGAAPARSGSADLKSAPVAPAGVAAEAAVPAAATVAPAGGPASPRAKKLAAEKGVDLTTCVGTGAKGRIIERDVKKVLADGPQLTPAARAAVAAGGQVPAGGTGIGGRVTAADVAAAGAAPATAAAASTAGPLTTGGAGDQITEVPVKGIRKLIADRMHDSLASTAQLTLNMSADATAALGFRKRLKASPEELGLNKVTINDLVLFAVARTLPQHPDLNALFENDTVYQHSNVQLAFAVDTPRGLMVPVIRDANRLSLKQLSDAGKALARGCIEGGVNPDDLQGGTITVSNLGAYGVENFTPILNPPQVAILGVGKADLKPVQVDGEVRFVPHFALSLTINHMAVDGGPAAKFLTAVCACLANIDLYLAV